MEQRGFPMSPEGLEIVRSIADQVNKADLRGLTWPELRLGVVIVANTAVTPNTCDVLLGNDVTDDPATDIACALGYVPVVNDVTFILKNGTDMIAVGGLGTRAAFGVETIAAGLVAASGFAATEFNGRRAAGVTFIEVRLDRTGGTITQTNSNITDTLVCTLPAGWTPPTLMFPVFNCQNARHGVMEVDPNGTCIIDTCSTDIITGDSIKFHLCWV
jgi:hypothetical protein